jgi:NAD(P)H-dependent FMN reductase
VFHENSLAVFMDIHEADLQLCALRYPGRSSRPLRSGGIRAVQVTKQTLTTLKMVPLVEAVAIQTVTQQLDEDKELRPSDVHTSSARTMLDELLRWAEALKPLRGPA